MTLKKVLNMFETTRSILLGLACLALIGPCIANLPSLDHVEPAHSLHSTKKTAWSTWLSQLQFHSTTRADRNLASDSTDYEYKAEKWQAKDPNVGSYSSARNAQRLALVTLYYATDGDESWTDNTNWLVYDVSECEWFSSLDADEVCDGDVYIGLGLNENNLTGSVPATVFEGLPSLQVLDLSENVITGKIPTTIGSIGR